MTENTDYLDLQVNGYAGVDFNQDGLTADTLHHACESLNGDGVAGILATIITEHVDRMEGSLRQLVALRERDELAQRIIRGIHIEGPFLNPEEGYRGAHPVDAIRPADLDAMHRLVDAAGGLTRLVTLAPEHDHNLAVTRELTKRGVTVSAGHCNPSCDQLDAAIDAGLRMFTHLGNGCPRLVDRHDNIIQRALSRADRLWLCFIADGVHVPLFALRNYFKAAGLQRCIVVSDAIAAAGLGPGIHRLGRWHVEVGEDLAAWAPGHAHLVGSAITMPRAAQNLARGCGLDMAQIRQLTHDHAAQFMA